MTLTHVLAMRQNEKSTNWHEMGNVEYHAKQLMISVRNAMLHAILSFRDWTV